MDWHELEKMKVTDLRELAKEKTDLEAVSGLLKEQLVEAIAKALEIPRPHKVVKGGNKQAIKSQIRALKEQRERARSQHSRDQLRRHRRKIHALKRKLRRQADLTH